VYNQKYHKVHYMQHDMHKETNRINMYCVMLKTSFKPKSILRLF